jgi:hypothetical protein
MLPQRIVCEWNKKFKHGLKSFAHEEGPGQLFLDTNEDNAESAHDIVLLDK